MTSTIGTVRVRDSHMTSTEIADHLATLVGDRKISDRAAITIASWWQSPGAIGNVLAGFASGARVDANDLHDDIMATIRDHARTMGAELDADNIAELHRLADWVDRKRSGARIIVDTYRVVDDGHGGSVDVDHDIRETFIPARAEHGDGWHESAARVIANDIRGEALTFDDSCDWAHTEPYQHPHDNTVTETTAHLQNMRETDEHRVRRMVNHGR